MRLQRASAKLQEVREAAKAEQQPQQEPQFRPGPVRPESPLATAASSSQKSQKLDKVIAQLRKRDSRPAAVRPDTVAEVLNSSRRLERLDKTLARLQEMQGTAAAEKSGLQQPELNPGPMRSDSPAVANSAPSPRQQRIDQAVAKLQDMRAAAKAKDTALSRPDAMQSTRLPHSPINRFARSEAAQASNAVSSVGPGYTVTNGNFLSQTFRQETSTSSGKAPIKTLLKAYGRVILKITLSALRLLIGLAFACSQCWHPFFGFSNQKCVLFGWILSLSNHKPGSCCNSNSLEMQNVQGGLCQTAFTLCHALPHCAVLHQSMLCCL